MFNLYICKIMLFYFHGYLASNRGRKFTHEMEYHGEWEHTWDELDPSKRGMG